MMKNVSYVHWFLQRRGVWSNHAYHSIYLSHCMEGLWIAVLRFDPTIAAFSTYLHWRLRGAYGQAQREIDYLKPNQRKAVKEGRLVVPDTLSLDFEFRGEGRCLRDMIVASDFDLDDMVDGSEWWERAIAACKDAREAYVLLASYGYSVSLADIACTLKVSQSRVGQIRERAMIRVRKSRLIKV